MKNRSEKHSKYYKKLDLPPPSQKNSSLWINFFNKIESFIQAGQFWAKGQRIMDELDIDSTLAQTFILHAETHDLLKKSFQGECPNCGNFLIEIADEEIKLGKILKECNQCFQFVEIEKETIEIVLNFNITFFDYLFQDNDLTPEEKEIKRRLNEIFNASQKKGISNNEKGKKFEVFSKELLKIIDGFEFKKQNQLTETSEIDLIFFNNSTKFGFNQDYFIVQSKNQKKTTDVNAVCHLVSDMLIRDTKLGFIITSSNISKNAFKRILEHFTRNSLSIIVIDRDNIEKFFKNMDLEKIIEIQYYNLRFKHL